MPRHDTDASSVSASCDGESLQEQFNAQCEHRALGRCQNASSPSCRLPTELLSSIFLRVAEGRLGEIWTGWERVTHVCSHWRSVALDCTALWSTLNSDQPQKITDMMLSRSGDALLSIRYEYRAVGALSDTIAIAVLAPQRVQSLTLQVRQETPSLKSLFSGLHCGELPLEKLSITNLILYHSPESKNILPEDFLRVGAPFLRHLTMNSVGAPWSALPFTPRITLLHLSRGRDSNPSQLPTMSMLVASIRQMPLIEKLHLFHYLPNNENDETFDILDMVALRFMSLGGSHLALADFVQLVSCPNVTTVKMSFEGYAPDEHQEVDRALRDLRVSVSSSQGGDSWGDVFSRPRHLELRDLGGLSFRVWFGDEVGSPPLSDAGLTLGFRPRFNRTRVWLPVDPRPYFDIIRRRLDMSPLLSFTQSSNPIHNLWAGLSELPHLQSISVKQGGKAIMMSLCDVLVPSQHSEYHQAAERAPTFPALSTLRIVGGIQVLYDNTEEHLSDCGVLLVETFLERQKIVNLSVKLPLCLEKDYSNLEVIRKCLPGVHVTDDRY